MVKILNVISLNALSDVENNPLSNVSLNNSVKIPQSSTTTNNIGDNINAGLLIKDINSIGSGDFYRINVDSSAHVIPHLYFNNNVIIDSSNLLSELETELVDNNHELDTSNIIVHGGYINFVNGTHPNSNIGSNGVGLRYNSNNTVQFKNFNTDWIDLVDITKHDQFSELIDVDVVTNPLLNNQYITYSSISQKYINSNLSIISDPIPKLGGNLYTGNNLIQFGAETNRLVYNGDNTAIINNNLLVLQNNTTYISVSNYIEIANADSNQPPSIKAKSTLDTDVDLLISTLGSGTLQLYSSNGNIQLNAEQGNIYTNSDSLIVKGFISSSIYKSSSKLGGYTPNTSWPIPLSSDTILFDFNNTTSNGTYWANVGVGVDGQKLNIIYNNKSSNSISVLANFGSNGVIIGTGYSNGLEFNVNGQSSSLVYLGDDIDAWQVLNTGSGVF